MVDDSHVILVNIYAPNDLNQQLAFFNDLQHTLQEFAQEYIIMGGDFNCALHYKDKIGGNPVSKKILVIKKIVSGNIETLRKQNSRFPSGSVIKCLFSTEKFSRTTIHSGIFLGRAQCKQ